ncbi:RES family NAD+ phosphorylase [Candidatus Binatia bacterium]|nr:RES family NAD+ phosphorylase [Candidatus Binatia bacterium]
MSQSIWTRCAGSSRVTALSLAAWRVVESQFVTSTRRLVDSDAEQELLEQLIEIVKPPLPSDRAFARLHFLLSTPFRHPPLPHGSRFGTRTERGIWYGARTLPAAFAEVAYYRLVFLEGTAADLGTVTVELSAFAAAVRTNRGVDLTVPPFAAHEAQISSKTSYAVSQPLGREMREAGVEAFLYVSARDPARGTNIGLFAPAFARRKPSAPSTWVCTATRQHVELSKKDLFRKRRFTFHRAEFVVEGSIPIPTAIPTPRK